MSQTEPVSPALVEGPVSIVRLHAEACFDCGAVGKGLIPAGQVQLVGSDQVWSIVSCGCRVRAVAS